MFLLALLGCQAFASDSHWKSEVDKESNTFWSAIVALLAQTYWKRTVTSWVIPYGTTFREGEFLDAAEKRLNMTLAPRNISTTEADGGIWIHGNAGKLTLSAYYHPTKLHMAGIYSGKTGQILPVKNLTAAAGTWVVAFGNPGTPNGNFPLYRVL